MQLTWITNTVTATLWVSNGIQKRTASRNFQFLILVAQAIDTVPILFLHPNHAGQKSQIRNVVKYRRSSGFAINTSSQFLAHIMVNLFQTLRFGSIPGPRIQKARS